MDVAIVTGAASGIGLAISRKLVEIGCRVYGLGGNFANTPYSHEYFIPTPCELTEIEAIKEKVEQILTKERGVFILVNNAKYFGSKPFLDEVNLAEFETVIRINLLCPLVLTRLALPSLEKLQGFIINIASGSPNSARGGPAGASAAGGLRWMGEALFEECRGSGVKVTTIFPQANRQGPSQADTHPESSYQTTIAPDAVARAVERIIRESDENVITEIVIRPQRLTEKPIPAPLLIPFPKIPKAITPDRPTSTLRALAEAEEAITSAAKKARKTSKKDMPTRAKSEEKKSQKSSSTERESVLKKTPSARKIKQTPKKSVAGKVEQKKTPASKKTKAKESSQVTKVRAKLRQKSKKKTSATVVPPQKLQSRTTKDPGPDPKRNRRITPNQTS